MDGYLDQQVPYTLANVSMGLFTSKLRWASCGMLWCCFIVVACDLCEASAFALKTAFSSVRTNAKTKCDVFHCAA